VGDDGCRLGFIRGVPVVSAPWFIDISNAEMVHGAFLRAAGWGYATIAADMSATQFCDSSGLSALVRAHDRTQQEGGQLRLAALTAPVMRLLTATGLARRLCVFRTVAEAVDELPVIAIAQPALRCRAPGGRAPGSRVAVRP
jgi:anti-sigma B factor antagonist